MNLLLTLTDRVGSGGFGGVVINSDEVMAVVTHKEYEGAKSVTQFLLRPVGAGSDLVFVTEAVTEIASQWRTSVPLTLTDVFGVDNLGSALVNADYVRLVNSARVADDVCNKLVSRVFLKYQIDAPALGAMRAGGPALYVMEDLYRLSVQLNCGIL